MLRSTPETLIFDTHPIQYRSPVFCALARLKKNFKVIYFSNSFHGKKIWFNEIGKSEFKDLGVNLETGFASEILKSKNVLVRCYSIFKILKNVRPRTVVVYGYYLPEHWFIRMVSVFFKISFVFVGETFEIRSTGLRRYVTSFLRSWFFKGVHRFVAIGQKTEKYYLDSGISSEKIVSAKYCVDSKFFQKEDKAQRRHDFRKKLGIHPSAYVLLFVGRMFDRKRPLDAVKIATDAMQELDLHLIMVGHGELEGAVRQHVGKLSRIHVLGFQSQTHLQDIYAASDCLVVTSEFETWGLVINEAFAAGLTAIVTSHCGAAGDLVLHRETGFVFDVGDTRSAVNYVLELGTNDQLQKRLCDKAHERVHRLYHVDQMAEAIAKASKS